MKFSPLKIKWLRAGATITAAGIVILCSCAGKGPHRGTQKGPIKDDTSILMEHVESIADPDGLINTLNQKDQTLFKIRKYTNGSPGKLKGTLSCVTAERIKVIDDEAQKNGSSNVAFQIGLRSGGGVSCYGPTNFPTGPSKDIVGAAAPFFAKEFDPSK